GRDTLHPSVERLFKAFADYSLVQVREACGRGVESRFARLNPVQAHILGLLGLPRAAGLFAQPGLSPAWALEACAWRWLRTVKVSSGRGTAACPSGEKWCAIRYPQFSSQF